MSSFQDFKTICANICQAYFQIFNFVQRYVLPALVYKTKKQTIAFLHVNVTWSLFAFYIFNQLYWHRFRSGHKSCLNRLFVWRQQLFEQRTVDQKRWQITLQPPVVIVYHSSSGPQHISKGKRAERTEREPLPCHLQHKMDYDNIQQMTWANTVHRSWKMQRQHC